MQTQPRELLRQQLILKKLGYYTGPLDGIWGPAAIEAMRKFENRLDKYRPARPTGGMPLPARGPLPKTFWTERDLICVEGLTSDPTEEETAAMSKLHTPQRVRAKPEAAQRPNIVVDTQSEKHQHRKDKGNNRPAQSGTEDNGSDEEQ